MNLFIRPLGRLTSPFGDGSSWRPNIHSGTDFAYGYKKSRYAVADGYIYKVSYRDNPNVQRGRAIYQICDTPLGVVELCYYHCQDILLSEGDTVVAGQPIFTEGNTGEYCFVGGVQVKPEDKPSGKGSHLHFAARWVERKKNIEKDAHYLNNSNGTRYKDADGYYYRITLNNNTNGCFDSVPFMYVPTRKQWIMIYSKVVGWFAQLLKKI
jgi:murein DD-endopeptidase MepM/ murein hydrolase activator NlpD